MAPTRSSPASKGRWRCYVPTNLWDGGLADLVCKASQDPRVRLRLRLLVAYFLSAPGSHSCGYYSISLSAVVRHTGLTEAEVREALASAEPVGLLHYDFEREAVYVPAGAEVEHPEGVKPDDKRHVNHVRHVSDENLLRSPLHARFVRKHRRRLNLPTSRAKREAPSEAPSHAPCEAPTEAKREEGRGKREERRGQKPEERDPTHTPVEGARVRGSSSLTKAKAEIERVYREVRGGEYVWDETKDIPALERILAWGKPLTEIGMRWRWLLTADPKRDPWLPSSNVWQLVKKWNDATTGDPDTDKADLRFAAVSARTVSVPPVYPCANAQPTAGGPEMLNDFARRWGLLDDKPKSDAPPIEPDDPWSSDGEGSPAAALRELEESLKVPKDDK